MVLIVGLIRSSLQVQSHFFTCTWYKVQNFRTPQFTPALPLIGPVPPLSLPVPTPTPGSPVPLAKWVVSEVLYLLSGTNTGTGTGEQRVLYLKARPNETYNKDHTCMVRVP